MREGCPALQLLSRMLEYNPAFRMTAQEALQHEWFREEPLPGMNAFVHVSAGPRRPLHNLPSWPRYLHCSCQGPHLE